MSMLRFVVCVSMIIFLACKPSARMVAPVVPPEGFSLKTIFTGNTKRLRDRTPLIGAVRVGVYPDNEQGYLFDMRDAYYTITPGRRQAVGMFYDRNISFEAHVDISNIDLSEADTARNLVDPNAPFVLMALKDGKPVGYVRPQNARVRLVYIGRTSDGGIMSDCKLNGILDYWNGRDTVSTPFYIGMYHIPFEQGFGVRESGRTAGPKQPPAIGVGRTR